MRSKDKKLVVLITGAAAGIGAAVAKRFLENGHTVYALDIHTPAQGVPLVADITDEEQLAFHAQSLQKSGALLDAIFHFAGVHTMASFIEGDMQKIKRLMEINVLGAMLVNKTFHPLLAPGGRVYITSSEVAPLAPLPFNGVYSVSKTAVDCYAQALRQELNLLGQRVITLRPGAVQTELAAGSARSTKALCENTVLYKTQSKNFCRLVEKFTGKPMPAEKFAAFVYKIALKKHPKYVYAKHRHLGLTLLGILPKRWQCAIVKKLVNG